MTDVKKPTLDRADTRVAHATGVGGRVDSEGRADNHRPAGGDLLSQPRARRAVAWMFALFVALVLVMNYALPLSRVRPLASGWNVRVRCSTPELLSF